MVHLVVYALRLICFISNLVVVVFQVVPSYIFDQTGQLLTIVLTRPSWTQKLYKMAEETLLKKQFQRLIRKCEKRHQEKLDQLLASDPAILDAYAPSTFGIDRAVLEEMWLMDNLIGKKFILQKLKTLYYEDKVNTKHIYRPSLCPTCVLIEFQ